MLITVNKNKSRKIESCGRKIQSFGWLFVFLLFTACYLSFAVSVSAGITINKSISAPVNNMGLVGYWTFDGADMTPSVVDKSGKGNNGYILRYDSGTTNVVAGATTTVPG